jgi:Ran GTPase-activating protein (RanGAP) involved in mRNA processing and transport
MTKTLEKSDTTVSFKELAGLVEDGNISVMRLTTLTIEGNDNDAFALSRAVPGHPSLEEVYMTSINFLDAEVDADMIVEMMLVSCSKLRVLKIEAVPMKAAAVGALQYCTSLESLILPNNGFTDMDASLIADALAASKSIVTIDLSGNKISNIGCKSFQLCIEKNESVKEIILAGNSISGDETTKIQAKLQARAAIAA